MLKITDAAARKIKEVLDHDESIEPPVRLVGGEKEGKYCFVPGKVAPDDQVITDKEEQPLLLVGSNEAEILDGLTMDLTRQGDEFAFTLLKDA